MNTSEKYHLNCWVPFEMEQSIKKLAKKHRISISKASMLLLSKGLEANREGS